MPIDFIVQRDRTYKAVDDVSKTIAAFKQDIAAYDKQITENGASDPALLSMLATMEKLADAMTAYSQTEAAQKALNKITKD